MSGGAGDGHTRDFATIAAEEQAWLAQRRAGAGLPPPADDAVGLAFSGGGIRSAVFNLGVLEALEAGGVMRQVDYLSSVSGGGYIACAYTWLRAHLPANAPTFAAELADGRGQALDWIRRHVQYLVSAKGFTVWTLLASIAAAVFLNVLVLAAPLVLGTDLMTLGFLPLPWHFTLGAGAMPPAHDGFVLLLAMGAVCFALWPLVALHFAIVATRDGLRVPKRVDRVRVLLGMLPSLGLALLVLGSIPVAAHAADGALARWAPGFMHGGGASMTSLGALLSGALGFWRTHARTGVNAQRWAKLALAVLVYGLFVLAYAIAVRVDTLHSPVFLTLLALSVGLGVFASLNAVSLHSYYRDRLRETMMPALAVAPAANPDTFRSSDISPAHGAPFHIVCSTLNTRTSPDERRRARGGDCFSFTPLRYGSSATGWARAADNGQPDGRLAAAVAIAGAAVDPDSPQTSNRALSFLMALLNLRLGYWGFSPDPAARHGLPLPPWWAQISRELLGLRLDERWRRVHLSDGGQFENLGLYELIRRRVPYLIAVDAGADPGANYGDLGNLIERVRVDFGADVDLRLAADAELRPWRLGEVRYADGRRGRLLYFKTCVRGPVSGDILAYQRQHPSFPNESTADQFFSEAQFEAYRWLARETVRSALDGAPYASVDAWFDALAAREPGGATVTAS